MRSFRRSAVAVAVAAAAALALGAGTAQADPAATPDADDIVGVGSDTTEAVLGSYAAAYDATGPLARLASFDARGSATIVPRVGAAEITRPNGSSAGLAELRRAGTAVDFARSSRGPRAGDGGVVFIPFAKDTLRYALNSGDDGGFAGIADLTAAELAGVYRCETRTWDAVRPGAAASTVVPKIPQAGSGSRAEFLVSIGVTEATLGSCVVPVQENDPAAVDGDPDAIVPFSRAQFLSLAEPRGIALDTVGTGGYSANRYLYNVVRTTADATRLAAVFGPAEAGGFLCSNPSIAEAANFSPLDPAAGDPACGAQIVAPA